jgi:hypothetical protein
MVPFDMFQLDKAETVSRSMRGSTFPHLPFGMRESQHSSSPEQSQQQQAALVTPFV